MAPFPRRITVLHSPSRPCHCPATPSTPIPVPRNGIRPLSGMGNPHANDVGLSRGTIFPGLDKPFLGERPLSKPTSRWKVYEQMTERQRLMRNVQMYDFALLEATEYLDGHPNDPNALVYFSKQQAYVSKIGCQGLYRSLWTFRSPKMQSTIPTHGFGSAIRGLGKEWISKHVEL